MDFQTIHAYNRLVRRGRAEPLTCHCGTEYVVNINDKDEPVFRCYSCDILIEPGMNTISKIEKAVNEIHK